MKNNYDAVKIFKALGDESRLKIVKELLEKSYCVEELANILALSSSTISFHLKKLEEVDLVFTKKEQYYVNYYLKKELFENKIKDLIILEKIENITQDNKLDDYKKNVIDSFFKYGKLKTIPVQRKKKRIILEEIAKSFEKEKIYSEKEVNLIIADFHDDFCTIRRDMISENIFSRENSNYKLL